MNALTNPTRSFRPWRPLALAVVLLLGGCAWKDERDQLRVENKKLGDENQLLFAEKQKLSGEIATARTTDAEMTATLEEVQKSLEEIRTKELKVLRSTLSVSQEGKTAGWRDRLQAEIGTIRTTIRSDLKKLARLEKERQATGQKVAALEKLADELKRSLEEKETTIAALDARVLDLTGQVSVQASLIEQKDGLLQEKDEVIEERTKALNAGYVAVAPKKVLRSKGVVDRTGSVLGLGGAWLETGKYDPEVFRQIDTTLEAELTIPAAAAKVKVLPGHPKESYKLVSNGPGSSTLTVTDHDAFWRESRYLVVMIPD